MENLLQETIIMLDIHGKTFEDVEWIGTREYSMPIDLFKAMANHEYDNGFGTVEVDYDLMIVGKNWWLEREEYDGSEEWSFKAMPVKKPEQVPNEIIHRYGWNDGRY